MKWMIVCIGLLLLTSCAHTLATPEQFAQADYGDLSPGYKEAIQESMSTVLFDPYSAHYRYLGDPIRGCAVVEVGGRPVFGYLVKVGINAKNRMGGYAGEDTFTFLVRNEAVWRLSYFMPKQAARAQTNRPIP